MTKCADKRPTAPTARRKAAAAGDALATASDTSTDVAKPYEPTAQERKAMAAYEAKRDKLPPVPRFTITMKDPTSGNIAADHPDVLTAYMSLFSAFATGNKFFGTGVLDSLSLLSSKQDGDGLPSLNFALSIVTGLEPKDQLETMLGSQMAAVHLAAMRMAKNLTSSTDLVSIDQFERALTRLTRTFAAQMEAFKRYRSKGEQRVYVERVNVEKGGQAIVGPVNQKGEG